jgi:hypothetical protein
MFMSHYKKHNLKFLQLFFIMLIIKIYEFMIKIL